MNLTPATRMGLSFAVATGLYGLSFGALAITAGLDLVQTQLLSMLMFTGGSQFGFIGVIASGGSPVAAISAASLLGVRNAVYGVQMNALLRPRGWWKPVAAHVTIDESAGTSAIQPDAAERRRGFWVAGVGVFVLWNLCTLLGALFGSAVGDPTRFGLDGAAVAGFLGLLWPRLKTGQPQAIAVLCAVVTAVTIPLLPAGIPILVAAAVALAIALGRRLVRTREAA